MKNAFHRFISGQVTVEEITSEFEDMPLLTSQTEIQRIKKEDHEIRIV